MERIEIRNFGPIQNETIEVKDFMVFIGPQASGKSTIAKSIFFFKSLRDDLIRYVRESAENNISIATPLRSFDKTVKAKFLDFWGQLHQQSNIYLCYYFNDETFISLSAGQATASIDVKFSETFEQKFKAIIHVGREFGKLKERQVNGKVTQKDIDDLELRRQILRNEVENLAYSLFEEYRELLFIPAGRSLLATLSDQVQNIAPRKLDFLMGKFVDYINNLKPVYRHSIADLKIIQTELSEIPINKN